MKNLHLLTRLALFTVSPAVMAAGFHAAPDEGDFIETVTVTASRAPATEATASLATIDNLQDVHAAHISEILVQSPGVWISRNNGQEHLTAIRSPVLTTARLRVVGMPRACMASLMIYSRNIGPKAARPSPRRENGVSPEPLSWTSQSRPSGARCSPRTMARPSPNIVK